MLAPPHSASLVPVWAICGIAVLADSYLAPVGLTWAKRGFAILRASHLAHVGPMRSKSGIAMLGAPQFAHVCIMWHSDIGFSVFGLYEPYVGNMRQRHITLHICSSLRTVCETCWNAILADSIFAPVVPMWKKCDIAILWSPSFSHMCLIMTKCCIYL